MNTVALVIGIVGVVIGIASLVFWWFDRNRRRKDLLAQIAQSSSLVLREVIVPENWRKSEEAFLAWKTLCELFIDRFGRDAKSVGLIEDAAFALQHVVSVASSSRPFEEIEKTLDEAITDFRSAVNKIRTASIIERSKSFKKSCRAISFGRSELEAIRKKKTGE